jgi:hypothetical protein
LTDQQIIFMKKLFIVAFLLSGLILSSCGNGGNTPAAPTDSAKTAPSNAIDSAANNNVLPPSSSPGDANNSSLADTTYKAKSKSKDSLKK